jgi:hypothetical protein
MDSLAIFLSGGATNSDPALSLGGVVSSRRVRGLGGLVAQPPSIPAIRIDNIFSACCEGVGLLRVDENGDLLFTPPGDTEGPPVSIGASQGKIVTGSDDAKGMRVFRESGLSMAPGEVSSITLRRAFNGVLAMEDVTNAQRAAGVITYRAFFLHNLSTNIVFEIKLWMAPTGGQASWALGFEVPTGSTIQTVANEFTAPTAVTFVASPTEGTPFTISPLLSGEYMGMWIRKTFPVGVVAAREDVQLALRYTAAAT